MTVACLQGVNSDLESYAGFITVDKPNDGNMFFWFFPAQVNIFSCIYSIVIFYATRLQNNQLAKK
jgi:hypothetical protein